MHTVWKSWGRVHEFFAKFWEGGYIGVVKTLWGGYTFFGCLLHLFFTKFCENLAGRVHFYPPHPTPLCASMDICEDKKETRKHCRTNEVIKGMLSLFSMTDCLFEKSFWFKIKCQCQWYKMSKFLYSQFNWNYIEWLTINYYLTPCFKNCVSSKSNDNKIFSERSGNKWPCSWITNLQHQQKQTLWTV